MSQKAVRIIALFLAILIAGSVLLAAITSVAAADASALAQIPDTGSDGVPKVPIIVGAVAVILAVACVVIPKIAKK